MLVLWPLFVGLEHGYPFGEAHREITSFCRRAHIPCMDLLDVLQGRDTDSLIVHELDRHPNAEAHELAARALAPWLTSLALPPSPPSPPPSADRSRARRASTSHPEAVR